MENELNEWSDTPIAEGRLEGKVALITGGNSGIGLASAKRFVAEGAYVYITGRRREELDKAISSIGQNATAIQGDISNLADLDKIYEVIRAGHNRLDIVFANAGLGTLEPLGSITEAGFDLAFNVNVRGTLFTIQKALPFLSSGASIILTGSSTGSRGTAAFSVYSATKAAIRNFARSWALDLRGKGIRVNVLSPGATATPGLLGLFDSSIQDQAMQAFSDESPLGRVGHPDEIAAVAVFLASDESTYMTGSEIFVDGGQAQV
ncbi:SDR family NAD(P)-dependent oxidoreductase [Mucilaginibacter sp. P19]|uniref:SDR family oxidoreductase n=2 Tax=Mucilaginibacter TaxID=423349 RepID=A0AAE6JE69_9SPHI|nr:MULTISPECIES: SDR family oxidoreductase [Mucilaginibacter]QEM03751.1 SDR family oxidoreductase [Mucilaginibacter rubeus]QEM16362.1 SDR family oxidoreductase [Mucilaginibacter gossypii]QTE38553.1 SDR family oxidoreductase [Mucilaginibacter gossypii]QTE40870.1 SDR family oxidoreductase [Mucilaginibacter rubeus]QTE47473.1 SDR family oxidoreductase [Mucilaginibacter rubeus]